MAATHPRQFFNQQLEINRLFLEGENIKLFKYFFLGKRVDPKDTDILNKARMVAGSILDFFSHAEDQSQAGIFEMDEGWRAYIRSSFENSPILCENLRDNLPLYGGAEGFLWKNFAQDACLRFGVVAP